MPRSQRPGRFPLPRTAWVTLTCSILTFAALAGTARLLETSIGSNLLSGSSVQRQPGRVARLADRHWERKCIALSDQLARLHAAFSERYFQALAETPEISAPPRLEDSARLTGGRYGVIPPVHADKHYGFTFPRPVGKPFPVSWHQVALLARGALETARTATPLLDHWTALSPEERATTEAGVELGARIESYFIRMDSDVALVSRRIRYLRSWLPFLITREGKDPKTSRLLAHALEGEANVWSVLRERLLPRRVRQFPYLPDSLSGTLRLTITTDVKDDRFLKEFEDAIDMHWNRSPWSRRHGARFEIKWKRIGENPAFRDGTQGIHDHLARFASDQPALTTGGETTYVSGNVLVLGPGPITPRTLAHEFGHLLGFEDCYFRTLSAHGLGGLLGLAVLEWDNPIYGDELMCDNHVGVPTRAIW